ncbi:MAG: BMP family ABC transporter substrate-binding protein [Clostridiales bacterium]|jgi:basic membrane protein A|nr:BMP family ABC transporter substrate-binding protein [Clostridiales bacterium]
MKKSIAFLMVAALVMTLFLGACGTKPEPTANPSAEPTASQEAFKVGVIHIGNPADGAGYSYAHDQGIIAMQNNLGLRDDQIVRKLNIGDTDNAATRTAIEECIEAGCTLIFATSYGYMDTMEALAEEYPNVLFSHGTGYKSNDVNFNNYFGRIYQARYLSGIAAGLRTETNKIGYVAAQPISNSEVTGGIDAFAKGVAAVNPDAQVFVKVTNTWFDLALEGSTAEALLDLGCDVIAQHCDTTAPQIAAENAGVWGCGYNSDMTEAAPNAHLTAPIWNWGVYYTTAAQVAMEGKWAEFGNYFGGLKEGFVDISPLTDNCVPGTQEIIDQVKALMISGDFGVFDGKQVAVDEAGKVSLVDEALVDNEGNVIVEAGKPSLDDATIQGGINWYYENVVLQ